MGICAYCGEDKKLTREHLFTRAISDSIKVKDGSRYLERSPQKFINSDVVVKDVCSDCNNKLLGELDGYAKTLYDNYFSVLVKNAENISFQYDYEKLVKWLLKISFNSSRVHNSDVDILSKYKDYLIGKGQSPGSFSIFVHLVGPSLDEESNTYEYPEGWRVSQLRLPTRRVTNCVYRCIFINSFCFTLFVLDPIESSDKINEIEEEFLQFPYNASKLIREYNTVNLSIGEANYYDSIGSHYALNRGVYQIEENEFEELLRQNKFDTVIFPIERAEIENQDISRTLGFLSGLLFSREIVLNSCQKIDLTFSGYDNDNREVYEIQEVKSFVKKLNNHFPYWHFFLNPKLSFIKVLPLCLYRYVIIDKNRKKISAEDFENHLSWQFDKINEICHNYVISDEKNKEICKNLVDNF
jgi:hypothetical protein